MLKMIGKKIFTSLLSKAFFILTYVIVNVKPPLISSNVVLSIASITCYEGPSQAAGSPDGSYCMPLQSVQG